MTNIPGDAITTMKDWPDACCDICVTSMPEKKDFRCACGRDGFVDAGENAKNRYPCQLCWYKLHKPDSAVITLLEKKDA